MSEPWLDIVGIGEDGMKGLSPEARERVESAEIIIGGERHQELSGSVTARRVEWPSPFDAMIEAIKGFRGERLVILVTGDPLWYSAGARIARAIPTEEIRFHPQLSSFQLAACRLGWSLADLDAITVHGRPASQIIPHLAPKARLLILTQDSSSPERIAELLRERGFGKSKMIALASLGGEKEKRFEGIAQEWNHSVPDFHVLAVECSADAEAQWHPRCGGIPDGAFEHDGLITSREIRTATLSSLAPYPDGLLWDVGAGCGSVSVEWMRAARGAKAIAIESDSSRCAMIERNAQALGTEKIEVVEGKAPDALSGLPQPDAIFIGGGLRNGKLFESCLKSLRRGGRLVANAVTLESESILSDLHLRHGGEMIRLCLSRAEPIGSFRGWKASMPITQWRMTK